MTVAVLAGTDRNVTRRFLSLLATALQPEDTVLVAGPGDVATARSWRVLEGKKLVRPARCPPLHELVVVLDERAVPIGPWLGPLLGALDTGVSAAAARSNSAQGDELLVGVPYRPGESDVHRAFVASRAKLHATDVSTARRLSGPSLGIWRSTLEAAGGLEVLLGEDPVGKLSRAASASGRLVVAEGSYLHHGGGPPPRPCAPSISACLIVKDEEQNLPRCLHSLKGVADQVVVYDTGSVDSTREIAASCGALVVRGYWDGDFSRARNAALEHCDREWILWVDADEEVVCDPSTLRSTLCSAMSDAEGFIVMVDNLRGTRASTNLAHPACRLFRRAYGHWAGRLHEQVHARAGNHRLATPLIDDLRITHWGYLASTLDDRDKGRRNVRSAFSDLVSDSDLPLATRLVSLARSYTLCDRFETAIDLCRGALEVGTAPGMERLARRTITVSLLGLGRFEEALQEAEWLHSLLRVTTLADIQKAKALLGLGRFKEALATLEEVGAGTDDDGYEYDEGSVASLRASAFAALGRLDEAAEALLHGVRQVGGMDAHIGLLVEWLERAGRSLSEIPEAVPASRAVAFLGQLLQLDPAVADRILEAWFETSPSAAVLATAAKVAPFLPLERRTVWSARLRAQGLAHSCPLVTACSEPGVEPESALLGAALSVEKYGDERGRLVIAALLGVVDDPAEALRQVEPVAPTVAPVCREIALYRAKVTEPQDRGTQPLERVLVVETGPASIRSMALASLLARSRHVTLIQPAGARGAETLLALRGVDLVLFDPRRAQRGCQAAVAQFYAEHPVDTLLVTKSAIGLREELNRLVSAARVVVDFDDLPVDVLGDVVVLSARTPPPAGAAPCQASAFQLFDPSPLPKHLRRGICIAGDFSSLTEAEARCFEGEIVPGLAARIGTLPLVVLGPGAPKQISRVLPGALVLGLVADPTPWFAAVRAVLVVGTSSAQHWLAAAAMCATPALAMVGAQPEAERIPAALCALADPATEDLWDRFSPVPPPRYQGTDVPLPAPAPASARSPVEGRIAWQGPADLAQAVERAASWHVEVGGEPGRAAVEVRLGGQPDFSPSTAAHLVVAASWGYGTLPREWTGPVRDSVDELWVPTRWAKARAIESGVCPDKVHVIPWALDPEIFSPEGSAETPRATRRTTFCYVGDSSESSGLDALLEAFFLGFSRSDNVRLVVCVQHATDSPLLADARRAAGSRWHGEVLVVEGERGDREWASFYRACDVVCAPVRTRDPARRVLEAMACGLPVVLTAGALGGELDDDESTYLVEAKEVEVDASDLGITGSAGPQTVLEPSRASLVSQLRRAARDADERTRKGVAARLAVCARFSLERVAEEIASLLSDQTILGTERVHPPEMAQTGR